MANTDCGWIVARLDRKRLGQDTLTTKWNWIRGVFDEQTRRKPLVFAADAVCAMGFERRFRAQQVYG